MLAAMNTDRTEPEIIPPGAKQPQSYAAWLMDPMNREVLAGISKKQRELVEAIELYVAEYRGGKVKAEITIKHTFELKNGAYAISTDVKVKLPEEPAYGAVFFLQPDGSLGGSNPKQLAMPFTVVDETK
jgi:hypothetical protein